MIDIKDIQVRLGSAIIFLLIILGGLYWNQYSLIALFLIICLGCSFELLKITLTSEQKGYLWFGVLTSCLPTLMYLIYKFNFFHSVFVLFFLIICWILILWITTLRRSPFDGNDIIAKILLAVFYVGVPIFCIVDIGSGIKYQPGLILGIFILIWTNDTMAYMCGSMFGRSKLAPHISPNKTVEGTLGGIIFCIIAGYINAIWYPEYSIAIWCTIACLVGVFGTSGDLIESALKRHYGLKDSGKIMAGHGGFLDRFDSFLFISPFLYLLLLLI